MTQNTSSAVMAQRIEPHDSLDDYPSPPWCVRAFCEYMGFGRDCPYSVWEPAANRGYMAKGFRDYFETVHCSDVHDYGVGFPTFDFLMPGAPLYEADWIITNPPFRLAQEFVERALQIAPREGVAIIARSVWAEGIKRYEELFRDRPPSLILQHVERVPMVKGRYDPEASTATSYSWFVWETGSLTQQQFDWIPPARHRLTRDGDTEAG